MRALFAGVPQEPTGPEHVLRCASDYAENINELQSYTRERLPEQHYNMSIIYYVCLNSHERITGWRKKIRRVRVSRESSPVTDLLEVFGSVLLSLSIIRFLGVLLNVFAGEERHRNG